jgi:hypothetical protein
MIDAPQSCPLPWFDQRRTDIRTDEFFGEFVVSSTTGQWCNGWTIGHRPNVRVFGTGGTPTATQRETWLEILSRFDALESNGLSMIPDLPPVKLKTPTFNRALLSLSEVWLTDKTGQFTFSFHHPLADEIAVGPIVDYADYSPVDAAWVP